MSVSYILDPARVLEVHMRIVMTLLALSFAGAAGAQPVKATGLGTVRASATAGGGMGNPGYRPQAGDGAICLTHRKTGKPVCKTAAGWRKEAARSGRAG